MHAQPLEARMAHIEGAFEQINERLGSLERKFEVGFASVDSRFNQMEARFNHIDARFNWLIGTMAGGFFTLIGVQITTTLTILFHR